MPSQGDIRKFADTLYEYEMDPAQKRNISKELDKRAFDAMQDMFIKKYFGSSEEADATKKYFNTQRDYRDKFNSGKRPHTFAAGGPVDPYAARGIDFNKMYGGFNPDLAKIDPRVAALLANKNRVPMASGGAVMGRGGDNMLGVNRNLPGGAVHLSDAEAGILRSLAPQVGGLTQNPYTGLPEAFKLRDLIPWLAPVAANVAIPWASKWADGSGGIMDMLGQGAQWLGTNDWGPLTQGALTGALTGLATGNMMQGIGSGMMSYGLQKQLGPSLMRSMGPNVGTSSNSGLEWSGPDENFSETFVPLADKIEYKNTIGDSKIPALGLGLFGAGLVGTSQYLGEQEENTKIPTAADFQDNYMRKYWTYHLPRKESDGKLRWRRPKPKAGMAGGGIVSLMGGGGITAGMGNGTSDQIPAMIAATSPMQQPQPAALSPGEFVVPADVVSGLGNGDTGAGASALQNMMAKVRQTRTGMPQQPRDVNLNRVMPV